MCQRLLCLIVLFLALDFSAKALAEEAAATPENSTQPNSEYLNQTISGKLDVTPFVGLQFISADYTGLDLRRITVGSFSGSAVEYALNSNFSVGAVLAYATTNDTYTCGSGLSCPDHKYRGFADPVVFLHSQFGIGRGTFRAGASAAVAVEHAKIDGNGDANEATGGTTVTPFLAYEFPVGPGLLGARIRYDVYQSDRKVDDSSGNAPSSYTVSGGQALSLDAFYEFDFRKVTFGGALVYTKDNSTKNNYPGVPATTNPDNLAGYSLQAYVPMHFTPTITLLPTAIYTAFSMPSGNAVSYQTALTMACGARFRF